MVKGGAIAPYLIGGLGLAVFIISIFFRYPYLMVLGFLASTSIFLENEPGITPYELFFLIYNVAIIGIFIIPDMLRGALEMPTKLERLALIFLLLIPYAVVLGWINGAKVSNIFSDATYYLGFATFFAFRRYMHVQAFRRGLLIFLVGLIFFVVIRNAFNYQQILLEAFAKWQAEKARVAKNEVLIMAGATLFLVATVYSKHWWTFILNLFCLGGTIAGIIITQSRGYWIALVVSYLSIIFFAKKSPRRRIIMLGITIIALSTFVAIIFFGDLLDLALKGLSIRLKSLGSLSSGHIDPSLKERFWEYTDILRFMAKNPFAGYGFGVTYQRYVVSTDQFIHNITSYTHNGYLAIWYKFGIIGLITLLTFCYKMFQYAYRLYHSNAPKTIRAITLAILGTLVGMLLVNNTSPQFLAYDSLLLLMLMAVFVSYYYEIYGREKVKKPNVYEG